MVVITAVSTSMLGMRIFSFKFYDRSKFNFRRLFYNNKFAIKMLLILLHAT
jgi:hypothetical protein